jgi:TonB family protein
MLVESVIGLLLLGGDAAPKAFYRSCSELVKTDCVPSCADAPEPCLHLPKVIDAQDPEYSAKARRERVQGTVVLSVEVDEKGKTRNINIVGSVREDLDKKAIQAVKHWRFKPAEYQGRPVVMVMNVEVAFRLF